MISHSDDKNRTTINIFPTESVFSRLMDFVDNRFICSNQVRSILFIPLDPLAPLFDSLFPIELSGDWKPCNSVNVGVKIFTLFTMLVLFCKDLFDLMLIWLNLSKLRVRNSQRIVRIHIHHFIIKLNNICQKYKSH